LKTKRANPAFDYCADDYARYRPGYPPELFARLAELCAPAPEVWVADVGAGTGHFSRGLIERGYRVMALEPSLSMLRELGGSASDANARLRPLCAVAERTGLADASIGLITCAQSFHWFNPPFALAEFGRVLRAGGALVLTWNNRDRCASPLVAEFEELVREYNPAYDVDYRRQAWGEKIDVGGLFEPTRYLELEWNWKRTPEEFIGFTRSVSYIRNVISRERIGVFEEELRGILDRHADGGSVCIPMRTDFWSAIRR
jgi:SAM-dependent methyltransferase